MSSCEFECYGPQGIQIIVGGLTDNMNRTIASLNGYLSKLHGEIAKTNSVKVFFDNNGYIAIEKTSDINQDKIMEETMEYGIVDIMELEDAFEIRTIPEDFYKVKDVLTKNNYKILEAELKLIPQNYISSLSDENKAKLERFIDCCDNDEDIQ
jgi:transcriptional/translational regulatory protein YebC/TACO1